MTKFEVKVKNAGMSLFANDNSEVEIFIIEASNEMEARTKAVALASNGGIEASCEVREVETVKEEINPTDQEMFQIVSEFEITGNKLNAVDYKNVVLFVNHLSVLFNNCPEKQKEIFLRNTNTVLKKAVLSVLKTKFHGSDVIENKIIIGSSFTIKDKLKDNGYSFETINKGWVKKYNNLLDGFNEIQKLGLI